MYKTIMLKNKRLIIVMPVYNEEQIIKKVVLDWLKIAKKYDGKLLIINDGSTDRTKKILNDIKNINLIKIHQKNSGHGKTLINGYRYALRKKFNYIFQVDSDNQFSSSDFIKLWKKKDIYDFQVGYRIKRYDPNTRLLITRVLRIIILFLFHIYIKDSNSPFRLINKFALSRFMKKGHTKTVVPNIFLSIFCYKKFKCRTVNVNHLERLTGVVWIMKFKLLKFCMTSFYELFKFRIIF